METTSILVSSGSSNNIGIKTMESHELPSDFDSDDSVRDPDYCPKKLSSEEDSDNEYINKLAMKERVHVSGGGLKNKRKREQENYKTSKIVKDMNGTYDQGVTVESSSASVNNDLEVEPTPIRKGRSRKQREECKRLRNHGMSYITEVGKSVEERKIGELKPCRLKCNERFHNSERKLIFNEYWGLGTRDRRALYLSSLITVVGKKTERVYTKLEDGKCRKFSCKYELVIDGERRPTCKGCFRSTFGETNAFINNIIEQKSTASSGIIPVDGRGRNSPKNKIPVETLESVRQHIQSFPAYESHYCRQQSSVKYLSSDLTISKMYELYRESMSSKPVSLTIYSKCFHDLNLSFKKPKVDTCHKCDTLKKAIEVAKDDDKQTLIKEQEIHHAAAEAAYQSKSADKEKAKQDKTKRAFAFDLQQCLPTPYLTTSVSFYKRQLWTFNLTIHDLATNQAACYLWNESISGRGGNEIASCLYKHICSLPTSVEEITYYSDTCGGQNKNSHVAAMFLVAMKECPNISYVNHKFLISGHTHMECDVDHSVIERAKKKTGMKINHPNDWAQLIRVCKKKNPFEVVMMKREDFLNFASLMKGNGPFTLKKVNEKKEKFLWRDVQWLRYTQESGHIFYKNNLGESAEFNTLNLNRKGRTSAKVVVPTIHDGPVPISAEKKKDLLELLPLVDTVFHDFYTNLLTVNIPSTDPDLQELDPDVQ